MGEHRRGVVGLHLEMLFVSAEPALPFMFASGGIKIQVGKQMKQACFTMWATLRRRQVWQPTLYMYLSWALSPHIGEAMFFWFNDVDVGPGFSQVQNRHHLYPFLELLVLILAFIFAFKEVLICHCSAVVL